MLHQRPRSGAHQGEESGGRKGDGLHGVRGAAQAGHALDEVAHDLGHLWVRRRRGAIRLPCGSTGKMSAVRCIRGGDLPCQGAQGCKGMFAVRNMQLTRHGQPLHTALVQLQLQLQLQKLQWKITHGTCRAARRAQGTWLALGRAQAGGAGLADLQLGVAGGQGADVARGHVREGKQADRPLRGRQPRRLPVRADAVQQQRLRLRRLRA